MTDDQHCHIGKGAVKQSILTNGGVWSNALYLCYYKNISKMEIPSNDDHTVSIGFSQNWEKHCKGAVKQSILTKGDPHLVGLHLG